MKKRILALALATVMMISTFNQGAITVKAEESEQISQEILDAVVDETAETEDAIAEASETVTEDTEEKSESEDVAEKKTETTEETTDETTDEVSEETKETADTVITDVDAVDAVEPVEETTDEVTEEPQDEEQSDEVLAEEELEEELVELNDDVQASTVRVYYTADDLSLVARVGTVAVNGKKGTDSAKGSYVDLSVENGSKLVLAAKAYDNCSIISATYTAGKETKTIKATNPTACEFALDVTETKYEVKIDSTEKEIPMLIETDVNALAAGKNGTYSVLLDKTYSFFIQRGDVSNATVKTVEASTKVNGKVTDVTKEVITSSKTFKVKSTSELAGKSIAVKVTTTTNNVYNYTMNVTTNLTAVTVVGASKNVAKVDLGTKKEFKLTVNKGASLSGVTVTAKAVLVDSKGNPTKTAGTSVVTLSDNVLKVEAGAAAEQIAVSFKYNGAEISTATINVVDNFSKLKPGMSMVSSTDTTIKLKLSLPATFKYANISSKTKAYYKVWYVNKTSVDFEKDLKYVDVPVTADAQTYDLKTISVSTGLGYAEYYYAGAFLCLGDEDSMSDTVNPITINTKNPAYETNLSLTRNVATVYQGQSNVTVATAKFSKNTTYTTLSGVAVENGGYYISATLSADRTQVLVSVGSIVKPGKYTIKAYSTQPSEGIEVSATVTITVAPAVNSFNLDTDRSTIAKVDGKAATLKITPYYYDNYSGYYSQKKTLSKVNYEIHSDNPQIYEKVKVSSNGVITVAKDYVLGLNNQLDTFYVTGKYTNHDGSVASGNSTGTITIVTGEINVASVNLMGYSEGSDIPADEAASPYILVYDKTGKIIDSSLYTYTVSGYKSYQGQYTVPTKAGKVTVTVKPVDGKTKPYNATFNIVASTGAPRFSSWSSSDCSLTNNVITTTDTDPAIAFAFGGNDVTKFDSISVKAEKGTLIPAYKYYSSVISALKIPAGELEETMYDIYGTFYYFPASAEDKITVTNNKCTDEKTKTVTYQIKNPMYGDKKLEVKLDTSNAVVYTDFEAAQDYTLDIKAGLDPKANYEYTVGFDMKTAYSNIIAYENYWYFNDNNYETVDGNTLTVSIDVDSYNNIKPKPLNIKSYLYLRKVDASGNVLETYEPIPFTVRAVKTPVASVKMASTYTMNSASGSSVVLPSATNGTVYYAGVCNSNTNGTYNSFTSYFKVENGKLVATKDLSKVPAKELTGYVKYYLTDKAGQTVSKTAKITVKVTVPKTQKK